ncbi:MAG: glycosyltransferase family 2 protein [Bacteroidales bacterium]|nr:glycosyltransferase family 2 protein [Bacteroidales bacterium]
MEKPVISVIVPVFNGGKYLAMAIESILRQSIDKLEIIVVDDASTDNSLEVAGGFGPLVSIHKQTTNKGTGSARNLGINKSTGVYLSFLDADDLWLAGKLIAQLTYLENNPNTDMVFGNVEQFISPELPEENQNKLRNELKKMPGFVAGTMLIRKTSFLKAGFFDVKLELGEFIDWFSRAKDMGLTYKMHNDIVLKRRIHTTNMGITKRHHLTDYTAILRAALKRKRMKE